ncbi:adenosine deaminase [Paenibacillus sacheonensis]|uniref:adenosine deaminase n=1 Tax=Paenibacillus sacheonensis TaxID=742054 RepID=A0A7X4YQE9_9BACL|nr:adenosine deaminase [Paenibacillus sacheonensis]MBM7566664.1 adenosine deaminase [Paenibacillus sacheonensis]NBC70646.1 adenosine deaminase [Paenibacillus sacheonensis]
MDMWHALPKVDLHVHLDGSLRPDTAMAIAAAEGIELPTAVEADLIPYMQVDDDCRSLPEYLSKFDFTTRFLQSGAALERVAYETMEQAAAHNCRYMEVRFAPQLHRRGGLHAEEAIHYVIEGLKRAERQFDIQGRAIAICMRNHDRKDNLEVIEAAAKYAGRGLAAVDLAGNEAAYPPELFRDVFALAHKRGLPVTIHAGEAAGAENVYEAVKHLGASRIGHGVRLRENPDILRLVLEQRIPLELCPVSNIQTKAVSDWDVYPIRDYFEQGLLITLNTDNPSVSGTDITREYRIAAEKFGFQGRELAAIVRNGAGAAFLENAGKQALMKRIDGELAALGL